jgi:hypothetical protein
MRSLPPSDTYVSDPFVSICKLMEHRQRRLLAPSWLWPALALWLSTVGLGFAKLVSYQNAPGAAAHPPTTLAKSAPKPRLLVFLHPQCPCSGATVSELDRLMASVGPKLTTEVYVFSPDSMPRTWSTDGLFRAAKAIPGVEVRLDRNGLLANSLGVQTSGQTLLYDAQGRLIFSGGITASRGHEGDNDGRDSIIAFVESGKSLRTSTPVFGCAIGQETTVR